jgi:ankyrin repeat protein
MAMFTYTPIDLERPALRLVRLCKSSSGDIECELFDAWLYQNEDIIPYEALSYTWGSTRKLHEITMNGRKMNITENLYIALWYLRYSYEDRILWVDALCIDQDNEKERGHQVNQMGKIYRRAERVVIWLGPETEETDLALDYMRQITPPATQHTSKDVCKDLQLQRRKGLEEMLSRPWFRRVWILQEVANARSAIVVCGLKHISTRIFALFPPILHVTPDPHCQAVLDIMPSRLRDNSWWSQKRTLHMLLQKFIASQATDKRDMIFALLDISSDACDTNLLCADYEKSLKEVVRDTASFLLCNESAHIPVYSSIQWTWWEFEDGLASLSNVALSIARKAENVSLVELLVKRDDIDVNRMDHYNETVLSWATKRGYETVVKLLIDRSDVKMNAGDKDGETVISLAVARGNVAIVKLLITRTDLDMNQKDKYGRTALLVAAKKGNAIIMETLLERKDLDINIKAGEHSTGETALLVATAQGRESLVSLLLKRSGIDINAVDMNRQTALLLSVTRSHEAIVKLLVKRRDLHINAKDKNGLTALIVAVERGNVTIVELLVERSDLYINEKDEYGWTALLVAAKNGNHAVVKSLLGRSSIDVNIKGGEIGTNRTNRTALAWAIIYKRERVAELLLMKSDIDVNLKYEGGRTALMLAVKGNCEIIVWELVKRREIDLNEQDGEGQTALMLAVRDGNTWMVSLLLEQKNIARDLKDKDGKTALSWAQSLLTRKHKEIAKLLCFN